MAGNKTEIARLDKRWSKLEQSLAWVKQKPIVITKLQTVGRKEKTQINTTGQAIIDFAYHGTPQSVIYLAHELGHAIADDIQNKYGRSFKDFSVDELERQAYFVQNMFTNYTGQESPESNTLQGLSGNKPLQVSWDRAMQYAHAENRFDTAVTMPANQRNTRILFALGGMIDINASTGNNLAAAGLNPV